MSRTQKSTMILTPTPMEGLRNLGSLREGLGGVPYAPRPSVKTWPRHSFVERSEP